MPEGGVIFVSLEEPEEIINYLKRYSIELGLNARVERRDMPTLDFIYEGEQDGLIRKCGSERKGFDTDFFQSLYNNRLINQVARSLEVGFPVILQVAGSLNYLNGPNSKAYSTFASESTGMGMPVLAYPNAAVLCHGFVRYCLVEVHHQYPKFHLMPNDVNRFDTQLTMQLKQFPGFGDEKAEKLGNKYKGPLSLAGVTIPVGPKKVQLICEAITRISEDLREGKTLKHKPKKPLKIVERLVWWLFEDPIEDEVDDNGKKQE